MIAQIDIPDITAKQIEQIINFKYDPENEDLDRDGRIDRITDDMKRKIRVIILASVIAGNSIEETIKKVIKLFPTKLEENSESNNYVYKSK